MNREQQKAMYAKKKTLPSTKINIANGRPDQYLTLKEPKEVTIGKWTFENQFPKGSHSVSSEGHLIPKSMGTESGIFHSTGFKHAVDIPDTPRGFDSPSRHFDVQTDHYGNVLKTRQGTPTYNGGDLQDGSENHEFSSTITHEGKGFIDQGMGRGDTESRSANAPKNKKYGAEHAEELDNKKEHAERVRKMKDNDRTCSNCGGSGEGFNWSNSVKASTGRVGRRTGFGKCVVCGGSGKA